MNPPAMDLHMIMLLNWVMKTVEVHTYHFVRCRNKDRIAEDVDSFKNFTMKYPELMFEVFKQLA